MPIFGSVALPCKMLLVRIIENDKIDTYFWSGSLSKGELSSVWLGKELG